MGFRKLALGAVAATSIAGAAAAQETTLIYNSYLPLRSGAAQVAIVDFAASIEEESGGSIKIEIPDATLAPSNQQYAMIIDGVADIAWLPTDDMSQLVSLNAIADLPGHAPTSTAASIALWETYEKYFEPFGEYRGVKVLSTHALKGRHIFGLSQEPLDTPEELRGTKLWTTNGMLTEIFEDVGIVPVLVNFAQLYETVEKGLVDGIVIAAGSTMSARVTEMVKSRAMFPGGLGSVSFAIVISEERWAELTEEQQAAILRAADGLPARTGIATDEIEAIAEAQLADITTVEASAELQAVMKPALDAQIEHWIERAKKVGIENPDEVLAFYRSIIERETASN